MNMNMIVLQVSNHKDTERLFLMASRTASRLSQLREWLGVSDYQRPFERARRMRFGNTGDWLFEQEAFMQWRDTAFEDS